MQENKSGCYFVNTGPSKAATSQLPIALYDRDVCVCVCACVAGGYATDAFEDVGHSTDARELMQKYAIGKLAEVSAPA